MHIRPPAGVEITVLMKNDKQLKCFSTMVYVGDKSGIVIYHKKKAIDEMQAKGWAK